MFVNLSNHNSTKWPPEQLEEAKKWGEITDYPFPPVSANATTEDVINLAEKVAKEICGLKPDCVMCQGEFTLTYHIVALLKKEGIPVVAGCSERNVMEQTKEDGSVERVAIYKFVQFREY